MGRFLLGFKLLFKTWFDADFGRRAGAWYAGQKQFEGEVAAPVTRVEEKPAPAKPVAPPAPVRSEAVTLLAVLQREARLVDFLKEEITAYSDAQIGAAVRDVHRDSAAALERMLALRPVVEQAEGSQVSLPGQVDAARYRLVGNLGAAAPAGGRLTHGGWQATRIELPQYTGTADAARVVAPAEVEV